MGVAGEEPKLLPDDAASLGVGEAVVCEEGEKGIGLVGGIETKPFCGFGSGFWGEATVGDEVGDGERVTV